MTNWVSSTGGPLICVEKKLAESWRGVRGLSLFCPNAENDYERACASSTFTMILPLQGGRDALILGDAPMDTIVRVDGPKAFLLRAMACDENFDGDKELARFDPSFFSQPDEVVEFSFTSSPLILFDSSCVGDDDLDSFAIFELPPGRYRILTMDIETATFSGVVHLFDAAK